MSKLEKWLNTYGANKNIQKKAKQPEIKSKIKEFFNIEWLTTKRIPQKTRKRRLSIDDKDSIRRMYDREKELLLETLCDFKPGFHIEKFNPYINHNYKVCYPLDDIEEFLYEIYRHGGKIINIKKMLDETWIMYSIPEKNEKGKPNLK